MTPKQRVLTACRHEEPDRVPLQIYLTPEVRARLREHFGERDILEALGIDLRHAGAPYTAERGPGPGLPGRADSYDIFGTGYTNTQYQGGTYPEATELPFAKMNSLDEVEAYPWPSADDYDYSALRERAEALGEYAVVFGGAGIPDIVNGVSRARGMERVLIDIMTNDPVGVAIIDHRVEHFYEHCRRALEAAGDVIDILDAMQPEPAGMDPAKIKREYGRDLTFCGLVSTQQTLPHGSPEDVRREVRERIGVMGAGGGYILAPAHCIQPDTPLENVLAIYEEALSPQ